MDAALTGRLRMQLRGIHPRRERQFELGSFDHRGHVVLYFDKAARRRLARAAKKGFEARGSLERVGRCYAVLSREGAVVTVGHRFRRINRG